jgi:hypothetical protein
MLVLNRSLSAPERTFEKKNQGDSDSNIMIFPEKNRELLRRVNKGERTKKGAEQMMAEVVLQQVFAD